MSAKKPSISPKTLLALLLYLIIPLCALLLILQSYPELPKDRFIMRIYWIIPTSTVIVILAQLSARYQRGDLKRFLLNIGFTVATMIWMFGLLGGGLVMTTQWNGYDFSLHMDKYVLLIATVAILNVLYYTFEWRVYRKDMVLHSEHTEKTSGTVSE
ncbi:MAG TPA: hypothetical protein DSN98_03705 [Thermoplasmata archaeon]|jgi:hypothetical protein|nr:MAG TPA: hypothetical protein DSN98_03705 [Thermoplasmata archaeon]